MYHTLTAKHKYLSKIMLPILKIYGPLVSLDGEHDQFFKFK